MSLTRIDFTSPPTLPGMDDDHNNRNQRGIDTFANRSPLVLPSMNQPTNSGTYYASSPTLRGGSQHNADKTMDAKVASKS